MTSLIGMLMLATLGFTAAFGYISARTLQKRRGAGDLRSTLCARSEHWERARKEAHGA